MATKKGSEQKQARASGFSGGGRRGEDEFTNLLGTGVDINDELPVYDCIAKQLAFFLVVGKDEAGEYPVGIVAVDLSWRVLRGDGVREIGCQAY